MDPLFNRTLDNVTNTDLTCYSMYEFGRTVYVPIFQVLVMIAGVVANAYMIVTVYFEHHRCSRGKGKAVRDMDVYSTHMGLCDIIRMLTTPFWITQTILSEGWVFGLVTCKLLKGLITFCFQYGIFLMAYINVERYMKVVHGRVPFASMKGKTGTYRRRNVTRLCAVLPAVSCLVDICFYTVQNISENSALCFNGLDQYYQVVTFWARITICFVLPTLILLYCNGSMVYAVTQHKRQSAFGKNITRGQILPSLIMLCYLCCWMPWLASTIYYRWDHTECQERGYFVLSVCMVIGNLHCITSPALYILTKRRRSTTK